MIPAQSVGPDAVGNGGETPGSAGSRSDRAVTATWRSADSPRTDSTMSANESWVSRTSTPASPSSYASSCSRNSGLIGTWTAPIFRIPSIAMWN